MFTTLIAPSSSSAVLLLIFFILLALPHLLPLLTVPLAFHSFPRHVQHRAEPQEQHIMYSALLPQQTSDDDLNLSSFSTVSSSDMTLTNSPNSDDNTTDVDLGLNIGVTVDIDDDPSSFDDIFPSIVRTNRTATPHGDLDGAYHGKCPEGYSLDSVILAETGRMRDTCLDLTSVSPVVSACEDGFVFTPATRACHNFTCYLDIIKQRPTVFESYDDYIDTCFREGCRNNDGYDNDNVKDAWTVIKGDVNIFRLLPLCVLKDCAYLHDIVILGTENFPVISVGINHGASSAGSEHVIFSNSRISERGDDDDYGENGVGDEDSVRPFKATGDGTPDKPRGNGNGRPVYTIAGDQQKGQQGYPRRKRPAVTCVTNPECPEFAYRAGGHCVVDCPTNFKLVDDKCVGEHVNPVCPPGTILRPWDFLCENIPTPEPSPERLTS